LSWEARTDKINLPSSTPWGEGRGKGRGEGRGELSLGGLFCPFSFPMTNCARTTLLLVCKNNERKKIHVNESTNGSILQFSKESISDKEMSKPSCLPLNPPLVGTAKSFKPP